MSNFLLLALAIDSDRRLRLCLITTDMATLALAALTSMATPLLEVAHAAHSAGAFCDTSVQQYSGYMNLTTGDKHLFYWYFESRNKPQTDPVVLWLTGGPGCSSEVALFGENGPCKVSADGQTTTSNAASWNSQANLLYVDQPVGTGFSYGKAFDHDEVGVGNDMYAFLLAFFSAHPERRTNPFYIFGESCARSSHDPMRSEPMDTFGSEPRDRPDRIRTDESAALHAAVVLARL